MSFPCVYKLTYFTLEASFYTSNGLEGASPVPETTNPLHRKTGLERKLTNRLLQVVQGLQERLGRPLDQALPVVHSLAVQLVLQVPEVQGCQDPLDDPGPPSHHWGPVTTGICVDRVSVQYLRTQGNITMNMNTSHWEGLGLKSGWHLHTWIANIRALWFLRFCALRNSAIFH